MVAAAVGVVFYFHVAMSIDWLLLIYFIDVVVHVVAVAVDDASYDTFIVALLISIFHVDGSAC